MVVSGKHGAVLHEAADGTIVAKTATATSPATTKATKRAEGPL